MASLRKIVSEIIEDLSGYGVTDDTQFDYELIKDKVVTAYQSVLGEFSRSKLPLDPFYVMADCNDVICQQDSCRIGNLVFTDKTIYYVANLPSLAVNVGYANISYLGLAGFAKNIDRVDLQEFTSSQGARYTSRMPILTVIGNTAVFKNIPTGLKKAKLIGIPYDPTTWPNWSDDNEFPIPSAAKIKLMVKKDILSMPGMPDLLTDAQRALGGQPQQQKQLKQDKEEEE